MNLKRGFKRITFILAAIAALLGTAISVNEVIACNEHASWYDVIPEDYIGTGASGTGPPYRMIGTIGRDGWCQMSALEKNAAIQAYNLKSKNECESGFWMQLSKGDFLGLCMVAGLAGGFAGFSLTWLVIWFGGLAIYKFIKWLILGFCDDVNSKQVEVIKAE